MARKTPARTRPAPAAPPSAPSQGAAGLPNPAPERDYVIRFDVPEFTCLCPLTGQPDFAHFTIEIVADQLCVETKSLKQYFWSYRNEGAFHEKVTNTIVDDIVDAIAPRFVRIHADWYVRGGIRTYVTVEQRKKGWKPAPESSCRGLSACQCRPEALPRCPRRAGGGRPTRSSPSTVQRQRHRRPGRLRRRSRARAAEDRRDPRREHQRAAKRASAPRAANAS